jgi:hypothetical protein
MWTQVFLPIEGQVLALLQVCPDEAKYAVVGTERIFDSVMAFCGPGIQRSAPPGMVIRIACRPSSARRVPASPGPAQYAPRRSESFGVPSPHSATPS